MTTKREGGVEAQGAIQFGQDTTFNRIVNSFACGLFLDGWISVVEPIRPEVI